MIYLDAAATSPIRREALEAAWPYISSAFGNPSSTHELGEQAAAGLADARSTVARILGCRAGEVVFTSGGTEANNLAVKGIALAAPRGRHIVTSRIEHDSVLESVGYLERFHGFEVSFVDAGGDGVITAGALASALRDDSTLVTLALANNEVGTVQDLAPLAALARARRIPFHTDAVQAAGSVPVDVQALGADALSLSGHKIGAPKGVGVLFVRGRVALEPLVHGGGQERGRRSGTENVAGAVGFATALRLAEAERVAEAEAEAEAEQHPVLHSAWPRPAVPAAPRDAFIASVLTHVPGAQLTGHPTARLPRHASFVIPGINGETVLLELEERGALASAGSACAAGQDAPSHVLLALGYAEDDARTSIRFTWTRDITADGLRAAASALAGVVAKVGALGA